MIDETREESQAVAPVAPDEDGVLHLVKFLGEAVAELSENVSTLTERLGPIMYNRAWSADSGIPDLDDSACSLAKSLQDIQREVLTASCTLLAINHELNL